jgi:TRAP-type C4-dicarboxylate transport system permease small subunit
LEHREIVMKAFVEFEKSVERAVCVFLSVAITTVLILWAVDARSSLEDAMAASVAKQAAVVVAKAAHGSSSEEV